jgi:hypothetical protein
VLKRRSQWNVILFVIAATVLLKKRLFDKKLRRKIYRPFRTIVLEESDLPKKGEEW